VSPIEIKPATNDRNDPASEFCIRCYERRGIFLSNKPDTNELGITNKTKRAASRNGNLGTFRHLDQKMLFKRQGEAFSERKFLSPSAGVALMWPEEGN